MTGLTRTLVDCAIHLPPLSALVVADSLVRYGADRLAAVDSLGALGARNGVRLARWVLKQADGRAESPQESALRYFLLALGFPAPDLQISVMTRLGSFRADLGWEGWRVLLEYDGLVKYTDLARGRPGEVLMEEKRRQEAIEEEGFTVLRITAADMRAPHLLRARVIRALPTAAAAPLSPHAELLLPPNLR